MKEIMMIIICHCDKVHRIKHDGANISNTLCDCGTTISIDWSIGKNAADSV